VYDLQIVANGTPGDGVRSHFEQDDAGQWQIVPDDPDEILRQGREAAIYTTPPAPLRVLEIGAGVAGFVTGLFGVHHLPGLATATVDVDLGPRWLESDNGVARLSPISIVPWTKKVASDVRVAAQCPALSIRRHWYLRAFVPFEKGSHGVVRTARLQITLKAKRKAANVVGCFMFPTREADYSRDSLTGRVSAKLPVGGVEVGKGTQRPVEHLEIRSYNTQESNPYWNLSATKGKPLIGDYEMILVVESTQPTPITVRAVLRATGRGRFMKRWTRQKPLKNQKGGDAAIRRYEIAEE
jgi:hypothetical protein